VWAPPHAPETRRDSPGRAACRRPQTDLHARAPGAVEHVWYDYKALIKKPRCMKVGPKGYGRPPYDFTNRYIGGPKQV
jgi:hypothetical protein